jgi:uncharacterized membrane protein YeaQ/YmgE (transglycosylase-associated protein family)
MSWFTTLGAIAFGVVVGWVTYGCLRRADRKGLTDLTTIIGAIGGATVTGLFQPNTGSFAGYCVGLAVGFFAYLAFYMWFPESAPKWLGERPSSIARDPAPRL